MIIQAWSNTFKIYIFKNSRVLYDITTIENTFLLNNKTLSYLNMRL